jgi:hypothetical protein
MGKREEILETLEKSHTVMMAQLLEVDKQRKIYPLWTIREIIAHLSGWDDAMIGFVNALLTGKTPPTPAQPPHRAALKSTMKKPSAPAKD